MFKHAVARLALKALIRGFMTLRNQKSERNPAERKPSSARTGGYPVMQSGVERNTSVDTLVLALAIYEQKVFYLPVHTSSRVVVFKYTMQRSATPLNV